jgi:hypothetical protein
MQVAQSIIHAPPREMHTTLLKKMLDLLHVHRSVREVVAYDDRGNVIGRVVAPRERNAFGAGRGAVYLNRD